MKFRNKFTYTYDVDPEKYPPEMRENVRLMAEQEGHFVPEIIHKALKEKKDGIVLTMEVLSDEAVVVN